MLLIKNYFGAIQLTEITSKLIEDYIAWRKHRKHKGKYIANRTVNIDLIYLSQCLKLAIEWGYLDINPCKKIKPVVNEHLKTLGDKIIYLEIDIDNSIDVYATMKGKRMLSGIPTLMFYALDNKEFYPSLTTTGGNIDTVNDFFESISEMV